MQSAGMPPDEPQEKSATRADAVAKRPRSPAATQRHGGLAEEPFLAEPATAAGIESRRELPDPVLDSRNLVPWSPLRAARRGDGALCAPAPLREILRLKLRWAQRGSARQVGDPCEPWDLPPPRGDRSVGSSSGKGTSRLGPRCNGEMAAKGRASGRASGRAARRAADRLAARAAARAVRCGELAAAAARRLGGAASPWLAVAKWRRLLAAVEADWLCSREVLPGAEAWQPDPLDRWCHRCGASVGPGERRSPCAICPRRPLADAVVRLGPYEPPLREWVLAAKYGMDDLAAERLGELLAAQIRRCGRVDEVRTVVAAVPMPLWRRVHRGIDHAAVIAAAAAGALRIPLVRPLRQRSGPPRSGQDRSERRRARVRPRLLAGSGGRSELEGLAVILVDDVLTTGATLREAGRWLRWMGAESVIAAVAAVTPAEGQRGRPADPVDEPPPRDLEAAGDDLGKVFKGA